MDVGFGVWICEIPSAEKETLPSVNLKKLELITVGSSKFTGLLPLAHFDDASIAAWLQNV